MRPAPSMEHFSPPPATARPRDNPARRLDQRSWCALGLVAGLILCHQLLLQPALARLTFDAPVVNVSGRQRMLSQKLAKEALALVASNNSSAREQHRDALATTLTQWQQAHHGLLAGDEALQLSGRNRPEIHAALQRLDDHVLPMTNAAEGLISAKSPGDADARDNLRVILAHEPEFLSQMHAVVAQFEAEARLHIVQLRCLELAIMAAILGLLFLVQLSVIRPAVRLAAREFDQSEAQYRQLVELAAGMAHEINQPLGAVANYAEGCLSRIAANGTDVRDLEVPLRGILRAALRGGEILRRARSFARLKPHCLVLESINDMVRDAEYSLLPEASRHGISLELQLAADLPQIHVDAVQIQQVLTNLIQNSVAALTQVEPDRRRITIRTRQSVGAVEIAVSDSGPGLPVGRAELMFEPFFTTKGDGMGMGLAIARSIVQAHGGSIRAQSLQEGGALFEFSLPSSTRQTEEGPAVVQSDTERSEPVCIAARSADAAARTADEAVHV